MSEQEPEEKRQGDGNPTPQEEQPDRLEECVTYFRPGMPLKRVLQVYKRFSQSRADALHPDQTLKYTTHKNTIDFRRREYAPKFPSPN